MPQLPATPRDLHRDRSIIALAAALCGALAAAGVAAVVATSQLSPGKGENTLGDVSAALSSATEELERSREILEQTRAELASARAAQARGPSPRAQGCRHRPHSKHPRTVPAAHIVKTTRPSSTSFVSTFHLGTAQVLAPPPVFHPVRSRSGARRVPVVRDGLLIGVKSET